MSTKLFLPVARALVASIAIVSLFAPGIAAGAGELERQMRQAEFAKGRLFPPELIMKNRARLALTGEQDKAIKNAVVATQQEMAGIQWDMQQAYTELQVALDQNPLDEDRVLQLVDDLLLAENSVKKLQMRMLIRMRNSLELEQIEYLKSVQE